MEGLHTTVLIPAYNIANYIGECLDSVLNQTFFDYDILVVDDGSTDATKAIVERYLPSGKVSLLSLPHVNVTHATKIGIENAQGPIITIVDGDDKIYKNALNTAVPQFQDQKVGFVWTKFDLSNGKKGWASALPHNQTLFESMMGGKWWRACHHKFFRKSTYDKTPGLNFEIDRASDFQLVLLLGFSGCNVVYKNESTYWYRVGRRGSLTSQGRDKQKQATVQAREWMRKNLKKLKIS